MIEYFKAGVSVLEAKLLWDVQFGFMDVKGDLCGHLSSGIFRNVTSPVESHRTVPELCHWFMQSLVVHLG